MHFGRVGQVGNGVELREDGIGRAVAIVEIEDDEDVNNGVPFGRGDHRRFWIGVVLNEVLGRIYKGGRRDTRVGADTAPDLAHRYGLHGEFGDNAWPF